MKRVPALDSIRGLLLVLMTINHLFWISGGNSVIQTLSLQPLGQFGAAECFVLVSGFLAGAIYSRPKLSNADIRSKAWGRAANIYRYHLVCLIVVFAWFAICSFYLPSAEKLLQPNLTSFSQEPWSSAALSALLINKPNYLEILPLYIMYMLLLPVLIAGYRRGWMLIVLLISVGIWLSSTYISTSNLDSVFLRLPLQTGYFDPFAWQLLFVSASAAGFLANQEGLNWYSKSVTVVAGGFALMVLLAHHGVFISWGIHQGVLYAQADKPELGWLRFLNVVTWAYLVAVIIKFRPTWLVFRPLSYIGRHSLQVFAWHTVLIYLMAPMLWSQRFTIHYELLVLICLASIWIPAWVKESSDHKSALKRWYLGGGGAVSAALVLSLIFRSEPIPTVVADAEGLAPLTIKMANIEQEGPVILLVYGENDNLSGIPSIHANGYSAEQAKTGIQLDALPKGKYAIFAFQDSDGNQQLTMDAGGMPMEGFGYSNNPALQGPPTMAQIQFSHPNEAHQVIQLVNL